MLPWSQILMVPGIDGAIAGSLEWPALGALLAWLLVLALLAVSTGVLRERRRIPSVPPDVRSREGSEVQLHPREIHRQAA